jgi:hypothetical protein
MLLGFYDYTVWLTYGSLISAITGIFLGLTHWGRFSVFLIIWALSFGVMLALYPMTRAIQKIGGDIWKE